MSEIKSLEEQQKSIQAELKQLENRHKILLNRKHKEVISQHKTGQNYVEQQIKQYIKNDL